jgi:hypothetical protein
MARLNRLLNASKGLIYIFFLNQGTLKLMKKLPKKLLFFRVRLLLLIVGGSEFVQFPIVHPDIFIGSVEDLSLHFHLETGSMGKLQVTLN